MKVGQRDTKIKGPEMKIMIQIRLDKTILLDTHANPPIRNNLDHKFIPHKFLGDVQILDGIPQRHIIKGLLINLIINVSTRILYRLDEIRIEHIFC
jgi:hypothetical protein